MFRYLYLVAILVVPGFCSLEHDDGAIHHLHFKSSKLFRRPPPAGYAQLTLNSPHFYKIVINGTSIFEAAQKCEAEGATLIEIPSEEVNDRLTHSSNGTNMTIGIVCTGTTYSSCIYTNGGVLTDSSYTNFAPGNPNPENGTCVYLKTFGDHTGKWFSGKCETKNGYVCQVTGQDSPRSCGSGYEPFGDSCYRLIEDKLNATEAEISCAAQCGHAVSIESAEENKFVFKLASGRNQSELWTGMNLTELVRWQKGKENAIAFRKNFHNFGHLHLPLGECVLMAMNDYFVQGGKWINHNCAKKLQSVCERKLDNPCAKAEPRRDLPVFEISTLKDLESFFRSLVVGGKGKNRLYRSVNRKDKYHQYHTDPLISYDNGWEQEGDIGYYMNETLYAKLKDYCPQLKKKQMNIEPGNKRTIVKEGSGSYDWPRESYWYCSPRKDYCGANFELVEILSPNGMDYLYPRSEQEREAALTKNDYYRDTLNGQLCWIWQ